MIATRSPAVRVGIRAATPFAIAVGTYLLFAGHNQPGGGFSAGLVFGAVVALRTLVGLQRPTHAMSLVAGGVLLMASVALAPLSWGDTLLDQLVVSFEVPLLGTVKTGSALPFDIGVTAVVVGVVVALLDGFQVAGLTPSSTDSRGER